MATEQARGDLVNTLIAAAIGAFLGYMAFGSFWHGALFGFLAFAISAVGNRVMSELPRVLSQKAERNRI